MGYVPEPTRRTLTEMLAASQVSCVICGTLFSDEDDVVWGLPSGILTIEEGLPYCTGCFPSQPGNENPRF